MRWPVALLLDWENVVSEAAVYPENAKMIPGKKRETRTRRW